MPRPSAMPPAAITGTFTASTPAAPARRCRLLRDILGQKHAAMAAGFRACAMMASRRSPPANRSRTMVADEITMQPAALTRLSSAGSGRPNGS